jgi:uncharacterized protein (DUF362 family)
MIMGHSIIDNAVYVYKLEADFEPLADGMMRAGYEFVKALDLPIKKRVVMKPNITIAVEAESGIITHPSFIAGMTDYFREKGLSPEDILVAEGGGDDRMEEYFGLGGYTELASKHGFTNVNLNHVEPVVYNMPDSEFFKEISIASTVIDKDSYFINVPKMKTHNLGVTTLCMKNLMGTLTPPRKRHLCSFPAELGDRHNEISPNGIELREEVLCKRLSDLSTVLKPDFNIIEGIVGRDGTAFRHGKNIQANLVIGGKNTTAVDAVASYLMGFEPSCIGYLKIARMRELGEIEIKNIDIYEVSNDGVKLCDSLDKFMSPIPFEVLAWDKCARDIPLNEKMLLRCQSETK